MNAPLVNLQMLPLPTGFLVAKPHAQAGLDHGLAWKQELERAQLASESLQAAVLPGFFAGYSVEGAAFRSSDSQPEVRIVPEDPRGEDLVSSSVSTFAPVVLAQSHRIDATADRPVIENLPRLAVPEQVAAAQPANATHMTPCVAVSPESATRPRDSQAQAPSLQKDEEEASAAVPRPIPLEASLPEHAPPVRLHADWEAQGVRIWLGLDADVVSQQSAIADHVRRWMAAQGVRVLSLSCNGEQLGTPDPIEDGLGLPARTASDPQPQSKEKPWRSAP